MQKANLKKENLKSLTCHSRLLVGHKIFDPFKYLIAALSQWVIFLSFWINLSIYHKQIDLIQCDL